MRRVYVVGGNDDCPLGLQQNYLIPKQREAFNVSWLVSSLLSRIKFQASITCKTFTAIFSDKKLVL